MGKTSKNFFEYPNKLTVVIFVIVCFVSNISLIVIATNYFKESLFQKKNMLFIALMSFLILITFKLYTNYLKQKY